MMCHKNNDPFSRKSIRRALKAWRNIQELDGHSLSRLKIVEEQKRVVRQIGMSLGQGMALRDLLRDAIEKLKPDNESPDFADKRWRSYLILTKQFIEGRAPGYVANLLGISHSTYNHSQATALDVLGNVLHELERNHANLDNRWAHECGSTLLAPPHPSHSLVGRHKLLKEVKKELFAGHSLAFTGLPGVGKTALAIELVNDSKVLNHFQDGVLWAHLGCKANVLSVLGIWAAALGISWVRIESLTSVEERARAVHAAIGQRQMLLVVDDARDAEMALTFRLGGRRCAHILTTRLEDVAAHFAGGKVIFVPELSEDAGLMLLAQLVPEAVVGEPETARKLVQRVGRLPLALVLKGNHLQAQMYRKEFSDLQEALGEA